MPNRLRRAMLFMPGDDRRKIEKGAALEVDSVIMDLEDGVALNRKAEARATVRQALREVNFGDSERVVRINPINPEMPLWEDDLQEVIEGGPDAIILPKVENADHISLIDEYLTKVERRYGWMPGSIRLLAIIETARGVVNLKEIAQSHQRLSALIFGAEDLAGDIGAVRTPDSWEVFYAQSAVVLHAKAANMQAIDTPFVDLSTDSSHLISETERAHYMGFTGKLAIHPRHVPIIQQVFTPSEDEIAAARRLIEAHDEHQTQGTGVFAYEGRMVDMPMIRAAKTVLARARAAENEPGA